MNEYDLLTEIISASSQGAVTIAALILWARTKLSQIRESWREDLHRELSEALDQKLNDSLDDKLDERLGDLSATSSRLSHLEGAIETLTSILRPAATSAIQAP